MKKILLMLFCIIFLIGNVSAFEFDNIGRYNETSRTFTIKNSILGIPFLQLGTVAEITLNSPGVVHVFRGSDRQVANFIINNYGDYSNAFKKMEFYDINNGMEKFNRDFTYKYKKSLGFNTINDYETVCVDKKQLTNGTIIQECHQELTGTHQEERFEWVEFDASKELLKGNVTIGIFTDVLPNDNVEWIPTLFGVEIDEWATWTDNFNTGLIAYYRLDGTSGAVVDYAENYDGVNYGATRGVAGKINYAFDFNGTTDYVEDIGRITEIEGTAANYTLSMWIKYEGAAGSDLIFAYDDNNALSGTSELYGYWTQTSLQFGKGPAEIATGITNLGDGQWHNFVAVKNATAFTFYEDGTLNSTSTGLGHAFGVGYLFTLGKGISVQPWDGLIDEFAIWNRSLNSTEVSDLWNGGSGIAPLIPPTITLNSPVIAFNSTSPTIDFNCTVSDDIGITNVSLLINGTIEQTNSSGINNVNYLFTETLTSGAGIYNWTCQAFDSDNQSTIATARTFTYSNDLVVSLVYPIVGYNSTSSAINFNGTASDDTAVINVSLYIDGVLNETNSSVINATYTLFSKDISEGDHNWTYEACDAVSCLIATTRNLYIDNILPAINVTYPTAKVNYLIINESLNLNWTATDANLHTCFYDYNGTNTTVTCADNTTNINITEYLNNNVTFWANDTFGNLNSDYHIWIYKIFENYQTFSSITIEGSTETFVNNIFLGSGEIITEVNLNYNGTDRSAGYSNVGGNEYNLSLTFLIPSVIAETNVTFFWKIILVSSQQINTSSRNQTVRSISMDDCSIFGNVIFEYTIIDEESQGILSNGTLLELDIEMFDKSKTVSLLNFSSKYEDVNPATVCLSIELVNETIYALDSTAKYESANYTGNQSVNYSIEYYNIQNFSLQNSTVPQEINLFDLLLSDSTEFQITFKDSNFVTVENALVQINRQYVSEGLFKTVEIPKTDSNGQTVAHLVEKDVVYNIIVLKEGKILGTFNNVIAFCEDILIGSCFISLNALTIGEISFDYDEDIGLFFDFDYNETSRNLQFDFSTTDGSVKNITLSALKIDQLGNETVCDEFLVSSSGSIFCPVPVSVGNETIIVSIFVDGDLKITNYVQAGREFDIGDAGYFLMFFLVLSLALMMTQSKTGVIIGVILGFISGVLLSFVQGGLIGVGSSVIWLIVMGVILIYKLNSQGQT